MLTALVEIALLATACTGGASSPTPSRATAVPSPFPGALRLVGHEPLFGRGMNAALAIRGHHAYVGSRTDGSDVHPYPGVLVVDLGDPASPKVVNEIGPPDEGNPGETSRELRVWPAQDLLIVMNVRCDALLHDCDRRVVRSSFRFYDIRGRRAAAPMLLATYHPSQEPHEFFLWQDPADRRRAILFISTTSLEDNVLIADISGARQGEVREVARWATAFPDPGPVDGLHSLSVSVDGRRAYLAFLTAGFFVIDTSEVASGISHPRIRLITPLENRLQWPGPGPHSAVKLPGRDVVLTTDEVYGGPGDEGCPWGWVRLIDVGDESAPRLLSEYRVHPYNDPAHCASVDPARDLSSSFSSHNPTVTEHLALVTWHSGGLQVFSTDDPANPQPAAEFLPQPLATVATEDPALSSGPDKVVMWSYPIVRDGLIYVVDVRNGLFILRYEGPYQEEVDGVPFLEGNSNLRIGP